MFWYPLINCCSIFVFRVSGTLVTDTFFQVCLSNSLKVTQTQIKRSLSTYLEKMLPNMHKSYQNQALV